MGCTPSLLSLSQPRPLRPYILSPIPFLFTHLRTLLRYFAFFCTHQICNSFLFKRFRTLWQKHPGWGTPLSPRSKMKRFPAISEASPARSTHPASAGGLGCPFVADFVGMRILRLLALGFGTDAGVFEGDHAFREGFVFEQGELALGEATGEERDAFADQHRNDSNVKLIHKVVFEEVPRQFAPAHQPGVFSGALAELLQETLRGFVDESDTTALAGRLGMRENVILHFRVAESATAHLEGDVVRFAPHDGGINSGEERAHRIVLGHEEKINRSIGAGNVTVNADAETQNDLAHGGILNDGLQIIQRSRPANRPRRWEACSRHEKDCIGVSTWANVRLGENAFIAQIGGIRHGEARSCGAWYGFALVRGFWAECSVRGTILRSSRTTPIARREGSLGASHRGGSLHAAVEYDSLDGGRSLFLQDPRRVLQRGGGSDAQRRFLDQD